MDKEYDFSEFINQQHAGAEECRKKKLMKTRKATVSFNTDVYVRRMIHNVAYSLDMNTSDLIKAALTDYIKTHAPDHIDLYPEEFCKLSG